VNHNFPLAVGRQKPYLCCLHDYDIETFFYEIFANFSIKKIETLSNLLAQYLGKKNQNLVQ
jgi:hypothetical protein